MEENNYYGSYEESEQKNPLFKILLVMLAFILIIVIIFFVIRSCGTNNIEKTLLKAGKKYYNENENSLPKEAGQCNTLSLDFLISEGMLKRTDNFKTCDDSSTYVKVCKLESGDYHYTPVIQCGTKSDTVFGDWKEGKESDLKVDKSDIKFTYIGEFYSNQAKQFYPSNGLVENDVKELYIDSPATDFTYKSEGIKDASKWYVQSTGTSYWNNGSYSPTAPDGYPNQGEEGARVTKVSLTAPASANYRTINQQIIYRKRNVSTPVAYAYICIDKNLEGEVLSQIPCSQRSEGIYTEYKQIKYTCDGVTDVNKGDKCPQNDWTAWTTEACKTEGVTECESKSGYVYTDKTWKWYVSGSYRSYYPSGSASASGENTYYVDSPKDGCIKDDTTTTTAYKYYKLVDSDSKSESNGTWVSISDDYLELEDLLKSFKEKGFEFKSLSELSSNDKVRYSLKLEYADRK